MDLSDKYEECWSGLSLVLILTYSSLCLSGLEFTGFVSLQLKLWSKRMVTRVCGNTICLYLEYDVSTSSMTNIVQISQLKNEKITATCDLTHL